jgi:hypothetical protein
MKQAFCVVKERGSNQYSFSKFHETKELAVEEAVRLSVKENCRFYVLSVLGFAERKPFPVVYLDLNNE